MSRKAVAAELNLEQSTYGNYELGKRQPSLEVLDKLADFFNVTTDYLLGKSDIPGPQTATSPTKPPSIEETLESLGVKNEEMIVVFAKLIANQLRVENKESLSKEFDTSGYIAKLGG